MVRKGILVFLILVSISVLTIFFVSKEREITNFPSEGEHIIAFGDSLVAGVGASSEDANFVSLLSQKIGRPIINLGVSGNTTADGLARIKELDRYDPKVVILLLGGNDFLRQVSRETAFANLRKIIQEIQSRGAVVVLLGVRGNLLTNRVEEEFAKLSKEYGTAYVPDVLDGIFGTSELMYDSIHPNDKGYAIIALRVYPVLLDVI